MEVLDLYHWGSSFGKMVSEMGLRWETYGNFNQFICIASILHESYTMPLRLLWDPYTSLMQGILIQRVHHPVSTPEMVELSRVIKHLTQWHQHLGLFLLLTLSISIIIIIHLIFMYMIKTYISLYLEL